jgi:hypothetical protein
VTTTRPPSVGAHRLVPVVAAAAAGSLLLTLIGAYVRTPWQHDRSGGWAINPDHQGVGNLLFLVAMVTLAAAVVFGVLVPRWLAIPSDRVPGRALTRAVAGAASVLVFWTGLPALLATGATVLALVSRRQLGHATVSATAALALSAATVAAAVVLAVTG